MNNYLTYCAQAKMHHMVSRSRGASGIRLTCHPFGGVSIEPVFTPSEHGDIILSLVPKVTTDLFTLRQLKPASIDFSYLTEDFIIKRDLDVILADTN